MGKNGYALQRASDFNRRSLMKRLTLLAFSFVMIFTALPAWHALSEEPDSGGSAPAQQHTTPSDQAIMEAIQERLVEDPLSRRYNDLAIAVRNGTVYLNGTVESYYAKRHIGNIVGNISGVAAVENDLTVAEQRIPKSDYALQQAIEAELVRDWLVNKYQITVDVANGVATLSGTVDSRLEVLQAVENAFEGGARLVINRLMVEGAFNQYPEYITRDLFNNIRSRYQR